MKRESKATRDTYHEYQRSHETFRETIRRLIRKYGREVVKSITSEEVAVAKGKPCGPTSPEYVDPFISNKSFARGVPAAGSTEQSSRLATLKEMSIKYGMPYGTLLYWAQIGRLQIKGREPFSARGGGKLLVDELEVVKLKSHPPRRGRPPTNPITDEH